jgi:formamidopyrimidine-DNA glycosylase
MPELPEVETTRRHLADAAEGGVVEHVSVKRDRMVRRNERPTDLEERLVGRRVESVGRRGKFILSELEGEMWWVIHLGMSGRLRVVDPVEPMEDHANVVFDIDNGVQVRFVDPRTFGFTAAWTPDELANSMDRIGPDALWDLPSAEAVHARFTGRRAAVKALLLDQHVMSGLGNIYADEVLIRAGIHPGRAAGSLSIGEIEALLAEVGPVLEAGIQYGGTSLDDLAYLLPDGRAGEYLARLRVYGRTGEPCLTCGTVIERITVAQRSSHFCPSCQPLEPSQRGALAGSST